MMNFVLGTIAGGLIACIATIAAARHPEIQSRLGLVPAIPSTLMAVTARSVPTCPPVAAAPRVGTTEMLFSKRRFWSVAP